MTHDEFVTALEDVTDWAADGPLLPAAARAHAAECAECARLLAGLRAMARDAETDADAVPAGYWDGFDAAVLARARASSVRAAAANERQSPSSPSPSGHASAPRLSWRVAAAILVAALVVVAWSTRRGGDAPPQPVASAPAGSALPLEVLATMAPQEVEAALAAFSPTGLEDEAVPLALPEDILSAAEPSDAIGDLAEPGDLDGPVETLEADLMESLSAAERLELARRLNEAAS